MGIEIIQTCDGCKITRSLPLIERKSDGGWREVTGINQWLCSDCIKKALKGPPLTYTNEDVERLAREMYESTPPRVQPQRNSWDDLLEQHRSGWRADVVAVLESFGARRAE